MQSHQSSNDVTETVQRLLDDIDKRVEAKVRKAVEDAKHDPDTELPLANLASAVRSLERSAQDLESTAGAAYGRR